MIAATPAHMDMRILAQIQHTLGGPTFEMSARKDDAPRQYRTPAGDVANAETLATVNAKLDAIDPTATVGAQLSTPDAIKRFVLGGRAIFTIAGKSARYTYQVTRKETDKAGQPCAPVYFVSMLTGPDNLHDYTYVGLLDVTDGRIKLTRKSRYTPESVPVRAWNWTVTRIWRGTEITPAKVYHVGRCGRCGRALTVPSSIESGFGPECLGKLGE
jgi:hypothetical protein